MKVVINVRHGGFCLSKKAYKYLRLKWDGYGFGQKYEHRRSAPKLVECVEKLGEEAGGEYARLKIVDVPDDVRWQIEEYDGMEWVSEAHRTWE